MNRYAIVLAAGKGSRMKTIDPNHSKVSYPILGKAIVNYVLDAVEPLNVNEIVTIVGYGGEVTKSLVESRSKIAWQKETHGTGHAVMQASEYLKDKEGETLILYGDTPLITTSMLESAFKKHEKSGNSLTFVSAVLENPTGYGRVIRQYKTNKILAIREDMDCNDDEKRLNEVNSGIYIFDNKKLFEYINKLTRDNAQHEYYLTDLVEMFVNDNLKVDSYVTIDPVSTYGVNDRNQLAYASKIIRKRINTELMLSGVSMEDPDTTYISPDTVIERDTVICPGTTILGNSIIGSANRIGPNAYIENSKIGNNNVIINAYIINKEIGDGEYINPLDK